MSYMNEIDIFCKNCYLCSCCDKAPVYWNAKDETPACNVNTEYEKAHPFAPDAFWINRQDHSQWIDQL